ncbi:hypothetical protein J1614_009603 [Plenodomus biglobosus]|nr:hypothetical protein J1614_009603 [Plenodomus biglobosus]
MLWNSSKLKVDTFPGDMIVDGGLQLAGLIDCVGDRLPLLGTGNALVLDLSCRPGSKCDTCTMVQQPWVSLLKRKAGATATAPKPIRGCSSSTNVDSTPPALSRWNGILEIVDGARG